MLDCTHFARQCLFTTETKTIFLPSSSFKFIFYMLQFFNNSTVLQVAKKPIETVLMLQYFKKSLIQRDKQNNSFAKERNVSHALNISVVVQLFPISFALSRSLTASCQPLLDWSFLLNFLCCHLCCMLQNYWVKVRNC